MLATTTPEVETVISTVTINHRRSATVHTPRAKKVLTQQEIMDGMEERLVAGKAAADEEKAKKQRAPKRTWEFENATKNRFEDYVHDLDFSGWSMGNPPRILTIVVRGRAFPRTKPKGSKAIYFEEIAPDLAALSKIVRERLADRFKSAFGFALDAIPAMEFQDTGNPHFHILLVVPMNADGSEMLSNHPKRGRGNLARFNGYRFADWVELTVSDLLGVNAVLPKDRSERKKGNTHLPEAHEVDPAASMEDYVSRFVNYVRKDGDGLKEKREVQHKTPACYMGQTFSWWGVIGFVGKRRAAGESVKLICRTRAADLAVRAFFAARTRRNRTYKEMKDGTTVDVSMWSPELHEHCLTGGTFERPLTEDEVRQLRRLIMAKNAELDEALVAAENDVDMPSKSDVERLIELADRTMAPAPWELPDFDAEAYDAWLRAAVSDSEDRSVELEEPEELLPLGELLKICGISADGEAVEAPGKDLLAVRRFSADEQRKAARTARRASWKRRIALLRESEESNY